MNVLEKILEEIEEATFQEDAPAYVGDVEVDGYVLASRVEEIIRSHMYEANKVGWISVAERLPEVNELVIVTVHVSDWVSNYGDDWVREEDKKYYPEEFLKTVGWLCRNDKWIYLDEYMQETTCSKSFGNDKGCIYNVVTAWQPLPEPYKGGKENE